MEGIVSMMYLVIFMLLVLVLVFHSNCESLTCTVCLWITDIDDPVLVSYLSVVSDTAYCRSPCTQNWYKYDDDHVSEISESSVRVSKKLTTNRLLYKNNAHVIQYISTTKALHSGAYADWCNFNFTMQISKKKKNNFVWMILIHAYY